MITTTATFEGNLAGDPEIKFSTTGKPRAELVVLVSERRQVEGEWVDEEPTRHRVTAFGSLGGNLADSLSKGDRVLVAGRVTTDSWTDKETQEKRTAPRVLADAVGVSLRWATAQPVKAARESTNG